MNIAAGAAVGIAIVLGASALGAQEHGISGPTVVAARAALFVPTTTSSEPWVAADTIAPCGCALKNAAMLGLGFSLAAAMLELTYLIAREPFVRRGHDLPPPNPTLIAWAGGAGFVLGLIGTERCRRRQR